MILALSSWNSPKCILDTAGESAQTQDHSQKLVWMPTLFPRLGEFNSTDIGKFVPKKDPGHM